MIVAQWTESCDKCWLWNPSTDQCRRYGSTDPEEVCLDYFERDEEEEEDAN